MSRLWIFAADTVLIVHVLFVAFVVFGLVAVFAGYLLDWSWVRNRTLRIVHLLAIGIVTAQAWLGLVCPLTIIENGLRARAGEAGYDGTFVSYWLHELLYYDAPLWVFAVAYTAFGALVLASWYVVRPGPSRRPTRNNAH